MKGLVIKGIGGFYYVRTERNIFECRGRGTLKSKGKKLAVGDIVEIREIELSSEARKRGIEHEGVIEKVYPRKNEFIRPPIVNVDSFIVTFAASKPDPAFTLIDKFIITAELRGVDCILLMTKTDLVSREESDEISAIYNSAYPFIRLSNRTGEGLSELKKAILGKTVCFAGPSGVGKSTVINKLVPEANAETGGLSSKTERGRHTTRHVEIFEADGGGLVYDTPGFASFDIIEAEEDELGTLYPEFLEYGGKCRYDNCRHISEPECAIREAVRAGKINRTRYESYKTILEDIKNKRRY